MNSRYRKAHDRPEPVVRDQAVEKALGRRRRVLVPGDDAENGANGAKGPYDGCEWIPPELATEEARRRLEELRRHLEDRARLVVEVEDGAVASFVVALSEAGFVVERQVELKEGDRSLLVARRDRFRVRTCEPGDVDPILELFAPLFHVARTEAHWRWKYEDNPWGERWVSLAVDAEGELAAHYAGYPVPFVRRRDGEPGEARTDEDFLAVQIGDTMTAPEHRRVGLGLSSLLGRTFRYHEARFGHGRAAFYYGFNTGNIRKFNFRFIRARWGGTVGYWRRHAEPPSGTGRWWSAREVSRLDPSTAREFDAFFERVAGDYGCLIRRDARWLRWRYLDCPDEPPFRLFALRRFGRFGRLVGWGVFRRHEGGHGSELRWVDALFDPRHAHRAGDLLRAALHHMSSNHTSPSRRSSREVQRDAPEPVREVTAWFSPRPAWWLRQLDRLGFERRPEPHDLGLIYRPVEREDADDLFAELYYTWGDSDLA